MGPAGGTPAPAAEEWEEQGSLPLGTSPRPPPRAPARPGSEDGATVFVACEIWGSLGQYGAGLAPAGARHGHRVLTPVLRIHSSAAPDIKICMGCF